MPTRARYPVLSLGVPHSSVSRPRVLVALDLRRLLARERHEVVLRRGRNRHVHGQCRARSGPARGRLARRAVRGAVLGHPEREHALVEVVELLDGLARSSTSSRMEATSCLRSCSLSWLVGPGLRGSCLDPERAQRHDQRDGAGYDEKNGKLAHDRPFLSAGLPASGFRAPPPPQSTPSPGSPSHSRSAKGRSRPTKARNS